MNAAILSIVGLIVGATLQYFFTRHIENQKHIRNLRSEAYRDLLKAVCEYANYQPKPGSKEGIALAERAANAKARICLYGTSEVVEAYSKWEKLGPQMQTSSQRLAFIEMVKAMRVDSGGSRKVESADLHNVLLGVKEST